MMDLGYFKFNINDKVYLVDETAKIIKAIVVARSLEVKEGNWDHGKQERTTLTNYRYERYKIEYTTGNTRSIKTMMGEYLFSTYTELTNHILNNPV